jgi:hypothetical protein
MDDQDRAREIGRLAKIETLSNRMDGALYAAAALPDRLEVLRELEPDATSAEQDFTERLKTLKEVLVDEYWKDPMGADRDMQLAALDHSMIEFMRLRRRGEAEWSVDPLSRTRSRADNFLNNFVPLDSLAFIIRPEFTAAKKAIEAAIAKEDLDQKRAEEARIRREADQAERDRLYRISPAGQAEALAQRRREGAERDAAAAQRSVEQAQRNTGPKSAPAPSKPAPEPVTPQTQEAPKPYDNGPTI